jgi:hypothetical protein
MAPCLVLLIVFGCIAGFILSIGLLIFAYESIVNGGICNGTRPPGKPKWK